MTLRTLLAVPLIALASRDALAQKGGFVVTLGTDTVHAERFVLWMLPSADGASMLVVNKQ